MSEAPVHPVKLAGVHHAAYRCKDAKETVEWYGKVLGMDYTTAFAEDHVPSTGDYDPYMHVFLDAGNGNILAFFELPNQKDMGRDENTPAWVQHLAFKVGSEEELLTYPLLLRLAAARNRRLMHGFNQCPGKQYLMLTFQVRVKRRLVLN